MKENSQEFQLGVWTVEL